MNRIGGGRSGPATSPLVHRRGLSIASVGRGSSAAESAEDESLELDLFLRSRGSAGSSLVGSDSKDDSGKLMGQSKIGKSTVDDLLDVDIGKHDYDWLLTPPGTPHLPAPEVNGNPTLGAAPKRTPTRSVSTSRSSRLSSSQTENSQTARPVRSSSVTRASASPSYISNNNRTSVLNTSSSSVTSRPSTPGRRPTTPSSLKTSAPASRAMPGRSSTPVKNRPVSSSPGIKTGPSQTSRPSTPTSRPAISTNSSSISSTARSASRPSTPTRQPIMRSTTPSRAVGRSPSVGRLPASNTRAPQSAPSSRPSSPSTRPRAPVMPIDLPDLPNDTPPNLRTKLPERPLSAGRSRPGAALTVHAKPNNEVSAPASLNRRTSLPIVARSKFPENPSKTSLYSNGLQNASPENQKHLMLDAGVRRTSKPASTTESTGFGRNISKKSMDMALKHMDIRQSMGGIRGASLFPHSIRPTTSKVRPARAAPVTPVTNGELFAENDMLNGFGDSNGALSYNAHSTTRSPDRENLMAREYANDLDLYGSYRYDMLLKEDSKNTNWLLDDKSDQSSVFDHRFEPLPEPFDPL